MPVANIYEIEGVTQNIVAIIEKVGIRNGPGDSNYKCASIHYFFLLWVTIFIILVLLLNILCHFKF